MADHQDPFTVTVRRAGFADFAAKAKVMGISAQSEYPRGIILKNAIGHREHGGNPELHRDLRIHFEDFFHSPIGQGQPCERISKPCSVNSGTHSD